MDTPSSIFGRGRGWKLFEALFFTLGAAFFGVGAFYRPWADAGEWVISVFAVVLAAMALSSWRGMWNNWGGAEENRATLRTLGFITLVPVVLGLFAVAVIASVGIFNAGGLFAPMPWWAAAIIGLLVAIYLKK